MGYEIGDLVWAKMKGFPPWPAKIVDPNNVDKVQKSKKSHQFVRFYGTNDHAWIPDENINPHSENFFDKLSKKRSKAYQQAIDEFISDAGSVEKQTSPKKKKAGNEKKSIKVVKVIHSTPKKRERNVLTPKSSVKKHTVKRHADVNGGSSKNSSPAKSSKFDTHDDDSSDSRHSSESAEFGSSRSSDERDHPSSTLCPFSVDYREKNRNRRLSISYDRDSPEPDKIDIETGTFKLSVKKIGFIGTGEMGMAILKKFIECGMNVTLYCSSFADVTEISKVNLKLAKCPAHLIANCDITFGCFDANTENLNEMIFGKGSILEGFEKAEKLKQGHKGYVGLCPFDMDVSKQINEAISIKNGFYLEAPVIGTSNDVSHAQCTIFASGNRNLFSDCERSFKLIARTVKFIDCDIGGSIKMSVLYNTISGTLLSAMTEGVMLSNYLNLYEADDLPAVENMLESDNLPEKVRRMGKHNTKLITRLGHVQKNLNLFLNLSNPVSQSMPVNSASNEVYKHARLLNYSNSDVSAIYKVIRY